MTAQLIAVGRNDTLTLDPTWAQKEIARITAERDEERRQKEDALKAVAMLEKQLTCYATVADTFILNIANLRELGGN